MTTDVGIALRDSRDKGRFLLQSRRSSHEFTLATLLMLTGLLSAAIVLIGYSSALAPSAAATNQRADVSTSSQPSAVVGTRTFEVHVVAFDRKP